MRDSIAEVVSDKEKPTIKLYTGDLPGIKDIDVDDKCCFEIKAKAKSKYREDYRPGNPLCITFEITSAKHCADCECGHERG